MDKIITSIIDKIDSYIDKVVWEHQPTDFVELDEKHIKNVIVHIFMQGNSIKITHRIFTIFQHWKNESYDYWCDILNKLFYSKDKSSILNFVFFTYRYLEIDFINIIIQSGHLHILSYIYNEKKRMYVQGLLTSMPDEEILKSHKIQIQDLHKIQKRLISEGGKKAVKIL